MGIPSGPVLFNELGCLKYLNMSDSGIGSSSSFEGYPLQVRHKQNWGRGFILLLPQTAALPESDNQMLAVVSLSQHRVSSSKTVRPCAPSGARCSL